MFKDFINNIKKNKLLNLKLITEALDFAKEAHKHQSRKSGQDYIIHPIAVAKIVANSLNDTNSVIASLLHDVVEDTGISHQVIENKFGKEVSTLVEGMTKLNKINFRTETEAKIENFRKFIISVSNDIRILVIKLADRLHNMQTIKFINDIQKQKNISLETLEVYVPLSERIGLAQIKDELEDLSFEILHQDVRNIIISRLENYKSSINIDLYCIEEDMSNLLHKNDLQNCTINSRIKRPFSIWKKMRKNNIDFEDIADLVALRIIVENLSDCYKVLGIIHNQYKSFFNSFRDYISVPKDNGYQSLHTCILFKPGLKLEIQIRTKKMHEIAESGFAAHWNYKNKVKEYDMKEYLWLSNILEIINSPFLAAEEKYEYSRLEMFDNEIFVFTPKGKLISLPKDSIVLDFAYSIHSDLGNKCIGAKINGEFVSVYQKLQNGTTIKIVTDNNKEPEQNCIAIVKTGYARTAIKRYWRNKRKEKVEYIIKDIIEYNFLREELEFNEDTIKNILNLYNMSAIDLYENLLNGKITIEAIIKEMYPYHICKKQDYSFCFEASNINRLINKNSIIELATCCYPIKGDKVVSVYNPMKSINVHRDNCCIITSGQIETFNRMPINWSKNEEGVTFLFLTKLVIEVANKPGSLLNVADVFYKNKINILEIYTDPINSYINLFYVSFKIPNINSLNIIIEDLESKSNIKEVRRYHEPQ